LPKITGGVNSSETTTSVEEHATMTTRERWIVYPLLFLTLGIAMRDKVMPPDRLSSQEVHCHRLVAGTVECVQTVECARLETDSTRAGSIVVAKPSGKGRVRLEVTSDGAGRIELRGKEGDEIAVVGGNPPSSAEPEPSEESRNDE
jgi:hypothetical protein